MICEKILKFKNICCISILLISSVFLNGCENFTKDGEMRTESEMLFHDPDHKKITELYVDFVEENLHDDSTFDLQTMKNMIQLLGENGYVAIDSENQVDMSNHEKVMEFCELAKEKKDSQIVIIECTYDLILQIYRFRSQNGDVYVERAIYGYENGDLDLMEAASYMAQEWKYTEEGYFMFYGSWFSEEYYLFTLSNAEEYVSFRVEPLDSTCRELTQKYMEPIGYVRNNLFIVNWNENDFGQLDFYDLFDVFFFAINGKYAPYLPDENLGIGAVYQIPEAEFENTIMAFLNIDSQTLRSKTIYHADDRTYQYKPRGFYEAEYPEHPYPEVVNYTENSDGTITLLVHAVFPYKGLSKALVHEVVVRPLENGKFQYVSNTIIPSADNQEVTWYKPRLTEEQWAEIYGGQ